MDASAVLRFDASSQGWCSQHNMNGEFLLTRRCCHAIVTSLRPDLRYLLAIAESLALK